MTLAFCILEFIGGKITGSLALIADASHMLTDLFAMTLAYFSAKLAARQPTAKMSFGFHRVEVFSALINGAALLTVAVFIVKEAISRFHQPQEIHAASMLIIAAMGLVVNIVSIVLLKRSADSNINIRGAFFHAVSDSLSSVGAIAAGLIIIFTGYRYPDA